MTSFFELRDYQIKAAEQGYNTLLQHRQLIINYEVRTGKSHIALKIADMISGSVLFVTKKKAIGSIQADYSIAGYNYPIEVINYEQLHKYNGNYSVVILDESHCLGAFPKPSLRAKEAKRVCSRANYVIFMTGTLLPESNAQIFHQLYVSPCSPFRMYSNFYKWFKVFGIEQKKYTSYGECNDYSNVPFARIEPYIAPFIMTKTQQEAGFVSNINEHFLTVKMEEKTYNAIKKLRKDKVIESKSGLLLADTAVKEMQKVHQMYSGTIKFEDGSRKAFDFSKSRAIAHKFKGKKKAIFYKFIAELDAIKEFLNVTDSIEEFNTTDKDIALQIVSGREGINLSKADVLIYYNIDFSAVSYWQSRDRMTTLGRQSSDIYWVFSEGGIEWQIYKAVINKKDFTLQTFKTWQANTK
jgi:hypothetical protein